jgi:hypothetical protein
MKIFVVILVCIGLFTASIFFSRPDLLRSLINAVFKRSASSKAGKEPNS